MSGKIIQLNEGIIKEELKDLVRNSVEETLNGLLDTLQYENAEQFPTPHSDHFMFELIFFHNIYSVGNGIQNCWMTKHFIFALEK